MNSNYFHQTELILIGIICLLAVVIPLGRWLYLRSIRIRNRIQMSYIFTNITHELLTPLTVLAASVDHLKSTQPEGKKDYAQMDLNIQRMVRLLQQILETSKSQDGNLKLLVSRVDVMKYIQETAHCLEPLMQQKKIEFTIHCNPVSMMGWIDTDKVDKIIFNLLSNAAKYTGTDGKVIIDVSTNRTYDHITIRVSDNGSGIPKDKMKYLYTRFYDGDYRRNRTIGTGLGLSLTRDLVFLHKGNIQCDSIVGQGTTFLVELPISKKAFSGITQIDENQMVEVKSPSSDIIDLPQTPQIVPTDITLPETDDEEAYKVLIVEDNDELMMLMQQLLRPHYHVMTASNGLEALDIARQQEIRHHYFRRYDAPDGRL